jgi:hypothetical protein
MNEEQQALLEDYSKANPEKRIGFFGLLVTANLVAEVKREKKSGNIEDFTLVPEAEQYINALRGEPGQEILRK